MSKWEDAEKAFNDYFNKGGYQYDEDAKINARGWFRAGFETSAPSPPTPAKDGMSERDKAYETAARMADLLPRFQWTIDFSARLRAMKSKNEAVYFCNKCGYVGISGPEHDDCNYHAAYEEKEEG